MHRLGKHKFTLQMAERDQNLLKDKTNPPKLNPQQGNPALAEPSTSPISDFSKELLTANYSLCLLTLLQVEVFIIIY